MLAQRFNLPSLSLSIPYVKARLTCEPTATRQLGSLPPHNTATSTSNKRGTFTLCETPYYNSVPSSFVLGLPQVLSELGQCLANNAALPSSSPSALEHCLGIYPFVRFIAAGTTSVDLLRLSVISSSALLSIRGSEESWRNLNRAAQCNSHGIRFRKSLHTDRPNPEYVYTDPDSFQLPILSRLRAER